MSTPFLPAGRPLGVVNEDGSAIAGGGGGGGAPGYVDATTPSPAYAPLIAWLDGSGVVHIVTDTDPLPVSGAGGGGGLTDAQLRASAVPVSLATIPAVTLDAATLAALESITVVDGGGSLTVDGTFWQATQPVSLATNTPDVTDRDARLLGRAKILDSAGAVIDPTLKGQLPAALVGGRLSVDASGVAVPVTGPLTDAQLRAAAVPVSAPALTKGTQGANGWSTQDLKDSGRNQTMLFMVLPILTTAAEVMMSLTGYKSGAAVAATTTPAVVTAGKVFRITAITITYIATATAGQAKFTFRVNTSGVAIISSPLAQAHVVGAGTPATAGSSQTEAVPIPDGWELPAGAGIAVGLQGLSPAMAGAIAGYGKCSIYGYEY